MTLASAQLPLGLRVPRLPFEEFYQRELWVIQSFESPNFFLIFPVHKLASLCSFLLLERGGHPVPRLATTRILCTSIYECRTYSLSLIHISEPTRLRRISYAVFCLKKKK